MRCRRLIEEGWLDKSSFEVIAIHRRVLLLAKLLLPVVVMICCIACCGAVSDEVFAIGDGGEISDRSDKISSKEERDRHPQYSDSIVSPIMFNSNTVYKTKYNGGIKSPPTHKKRQLGRSVVKKMQERRKTSSTNWYNAKNLDTILDDPYERKEYHYRHVHGYAPKKHANNFLRKKRKWKYKKNFTTPKSHQKFHKTVSKRRVTSPLPHILPQNNTQRVSVTTKKPLSNATIADQSIRQTTHTTDHETTVTEITKTETNRVLLPQAVDDLVTSKLIISKLSEGKQLGFEKAHISKYTEKVSMKGYDEVQTNITMVTPSTTSKKFNKTSKSKPWRKTTKEDMKPRTSTKSVTSTTLTTFIQPTTSVKSTNVTHKSTTAKKVITSRSTKSSPVVVTKRMKANTVKIRGKYKKHVNNRQAKVDTRTTASKLSITPIKNVSSIKVKHNPLELQFMSNPLYQSAEQVFSQPIYVQTEFQPVEGTPLITQNDIQQVLQPLLQPATRKAAPQVLLPVFIVERPILPPVKAPIKNVLTQFQEPDVQVLGNKNFGLETNNLSHLLLFPVERITDRNLGSKVKHSHKKVSEPMITDDFMDSPQVHKYNIYNDKPDVPAQREGSNGITDMDEMKISSSSCGHYDQIPIVVNAETQNSSECLQNSVGYVSAANDTPPEPLLITNAAYEMCIPVYDNATENVESTKTKGRLNLNEDINNVNLSKQHFSSTFQNEDKQLMENTAMLHSEIINPSCDASRPSLQQVSEPKLSIEKEFGDMDDMRFDPRFRSKSKLALKNNGGSYNTSNTDQFQEQKSEICLNTTTTTICSETTTTPCSITSCDCDDSDLLQPRKKIKKKPKSKYIEKFDDNHDRPQLSTITDKPCLPIIGRPENLTVPADSYFYKVGGPRLDNEVYNDTSFLFEVEEKVTNETFKDECENLQNLGVQPVLKNHTGNVSSSIVKPYVKKEFRTKPSLCQICIKINITTTPGAQKAPALITTNNPTISDDIPSYDPCCNTDSYAISANNTWFPDGVIQNTDETLQKCLTGSVTKNITSSNVNSGCSNENKNYNCILDVKTLNFANINNNESCNYDSSVGNVHLNGNINGNTLGTVNENSNNGRSDINANMNISGILHCNNGVSDKVPMSSKNNNTNLFSSINVRKNNDIVNAYTKPNGHVVGGVTFDGNNVTCTENEQHGLVNYYLNGKNGCTIRNRGGGKQDGVAAIGDKVHSNANFREGIENSVSNGFGKQVNCNGNAAIIECDDCNDNQNTNGSSLNTNGNILFPSSVDLKPSSDNENRVSKVTGGARNKSASAGTKQHYVGRQNATLSTAGNDMSTSNRTIGYNVSRGHSLDSDAENLDKVCLCAHKCPCSSSAKIMHEQMLLQPLDKRPNTTMYVPPIASDGSCDFDATDNNRTAIDTNVNYSFPPAADLEACFTDDIDTTSNATETSECVTNATSKTHLTTELNSNNTDECEEIEMDSALLTKYSKPAILRTNNENRTVGFILQSGQMNSNSNNIMTSNDFGSSPLTNATVLDYGNYRVQPVAILNDNPAHNEQDSTTLMASNIAGTTGEELTSLLSATPTTKVNPYRSNLVTKANFSKYSNTASAGISDLNEYRLNSYYEITNMTQDNIVTNTTGTSANVNVQNLGRINIMLRERDPFTLPNFVNLDTINLQSDANLPMITEESLLQSATALVNGDEYYQRKLSHDQREARTNQNNYDVGDDEEDGRISGSGCLNTKKYGVDVVDREDDVDAYNYDSEPSVTRSVIPSDMFHIFDGITSVIPKEESEAIFLSGPHTESHSKLSEVLTPLNRDDADIDNGETIIVHQIYRPQGNGADVIEDNADEERDASKSKLTKHKNVKILGTNPPIYLAKSDDDLLGSIDVTHSSLGKLRGHAKNVKILNLNRNSLIPFRGTTARSLLKSRFKTNATKSLKIITPSVIGCLKVSDDSKDEVDDPEEIIIQEVHPRVHSKNLAYLAATSASNDEVDVAANENEKDIDVTSSKTTDGADGATSSADVTTTTDKTSENTGKEINSSKENEKVNEKSADAESMANANNNTAAEHNVEIKTGSHNDTYSEKKEDSYNIHQDVAGVPEVVNEGLAGKLLNTSCLVFISTDQGMLDELREQYTNMPNVVIGNINKMTLNATSAQNTDDGSKPSKEKGNSTSDDGEKEGYGHEKTDQQAVDKEALKEEENAKHDLGKLSKSEHEGKNSNSKITSEEEEGINVEKLAKELKQAIKHVPKQIVTRKTNAPTTVTDNELEAMRYDHKYDEMENALSDINETDQKTCRAKPQGSAKAYMKYKMKEMKEKHKLKEEKKEEEVKKDEEKERELMKVTYKEDGRKSDKCCEEKEEGGTIRGNLKSKDKDCISKTTKAEGTIRTLTENVTSFKSMEPSASMILPRPNNATTIIATKMPLTTLETTSFSPAKLTIVTDREEAPTIEESVSARLPGEQSIKCVEDEKATEKPAVTASTGEELIEASTGMSTKSLKNPHSIPAVAYSTILNRKFMSPATLKTSSITSSPVTIPVALPIRPQPTSVCFSLPTHPSTSVSSPSSEMEGVQSVYTDEPTTVDRYAIETCSYDDEHEHGLMQPTMAAISPPSKMKTTSLTLSSAPPEENNYDYNHGMATIKLPPLNASDTQKIMGGKVLNVTCMIYVSSPPTAPSKESVEGGNLREQTDYSGLSYSTTAMGMVNARGKETDFAPLEKGEPMLINQTDASVLEMGKGTSTTDLDPLDDNQLQLVTDLYTHKSEPELQPNTTPFQTTILVEDAKEESDMDQGTLESVPEDSTEVNRLYAGMVTKITENRNAPAVEFNLNLKTNNMNTENEISFPYSDGNDDLSSLETQPPAIAAGIKSNSLNADNVPRSYYVASNPSDPYVQHEENNVDKGSTIFNQCDDTTEIQVRCTGRGKVYNATCQIIVDGPNSIKVVGPNELSNPQLSQLHLSTVQQEQREQLSSFVDGTWNVMPNDRREDELTEGNNYDHNSTPLSRSTSIAKGPNLEPCNLNPSVNILCADPRIVDAATTPLTVRPEQNFAKVNDVNYAGLHHFQGAVGEYVMTPEGKQNRNMSRINEAKLSGKTSPTRGSSIPREDLNQIVKAIASSVTQCLEEFLGNDANEMTRMDLAYTSSQEPVEYKSNKIEYEEPGIRDEYERGEERGKLSKTTAKNVHTEKGHPAFNVKINPAAEDLHSESTSNYTFSQNISHKPYQHKAGEIGDLISKDNPIPEQVRHKPPNTQNKTEERNVNPSQKVAANSQTSKYVKPSSKGHLTVNISDTGTSKINHGQPESNFNVIKAKPPTIDSYAKQKYTSVPNSKEKTYSTSKYMNPYAYNQNENYNPASGDIENHKITQFKFKYPDNNFLDSKTRAGTPSANLAENGEIQPSSFRHSNSNGFLNYRPTMISQSDENGDMQKYASPINQAVITNHPINTNDQFVNRILDGSPPELSAVESQLIPTNKWPNQIPVTTKKKSQINSDAFNNLGFSSASQDVLRRYNKGADNNELYSNKGAFVPNQKKPAFSNNKIPNLVQSYSMMEDVAKRQYDRGAKRDKPIGIIVPNPKKITGPDGAIINNDDIRKLNMTSNKKIPKVAQSYSMSADVAKWQYNKGAKSDKPIGIIVPNPKKPTLPDGAIINNDDIRKLNMTSNKKIPKVVQSYSMTGDVTKRQYYKGARSDKPIGIIVPNPKKPTRPDGAIINNDDITKLNMTSNKKIPNVVQSYSMMENVAQKQYDKGANSKKPIGIIVPNPKKPTGPDGAIINNDDIRKLNVTSNKKIPNTPQSYSVTQDVAQRRYDKDVNGDKEVFISNPTKHIRPDGDVLHDDDIRKLTKNSNNKVSNFAESYLRYNTYPKNSERIKINSFPNIFNEATEPPENSIISYCKFVEEPAMRFKSDTAPPDLKFIQEPESPSVTADLGKFVIPNAFTVRKEVCIPGGRPSSDILANLAGQTLAHKHKVIIEVTPSNSRMQPTSGGVDVQLLPNEGNFFRLRYPQNLANFVNGRLYRGDSRVKKVPASNATETDSYNSVSFNLASTEPIYFSHKIRKGKGRKNLVNKLPTEVKKKLHKLINMEGPTEFPVLYNLKLKQPIADDLDIDIPDLDDQPETTLNTSTVRNDEKVGNAGDNSSEKQGNSSETVDSALECLETTTECVVETTPECKSSTPLIVTPGRIQIPLKVCLEKIPSSPPPTQFQPAAAMQIKNLTEMVSVNDTVDQSKLWDNKLSPQELRQIQAKNMKKYMDTSINPCQDFYQYACGNWHKYHPIPADHGGFDTFEMLRENLDLHLRRLLENDSDNALYEDKVKEDENISLELYNFAPNQTVPSPYFEEVLNSVRTEFVDPIRKAKNLYASCMKEHLIDKRGEKPLLHLLTELRGWPILELEWDVSSFDLIWLLGQLRLYNNDLLISEWIGPDIKNSDEYVIQLDQSSLGLPSREYFLSETSREYIEAYHQFILDIVYILGAPEDQAVDDVKEIIDFEIKLAMITADPEDRRNLTSIYARLSLGELQIFLPQIDWIRYFEMVAEKDILITTPIVCYCMNYLQDLVHLLSNARSRAVANYLLWRFVRHRVNNLDERFQNAKQKFYHLLFGREASPPRWQFCVAQVNSNLGMALGNLFVNAHFDERSKNDTIFMTKQLEEAFKNILMLSDWLDDSTRSIAIAKVDAMRLRIGYPDIILNKQLLMERYKDIKVHPDYYFENSLSILRHLTRNEHQKIGKMVDKNMWNTAPAVVNAYYSRNKNQIMFPAGILQPPFYHQHFPKALNYGGIGVVIGHEITHGFDDKGRLFDKDGNLNTWWSDAATEKFRDKAKCIVDQYNSFVVPEINAPLDGMTTQGENIADNGGIKQSFKAYQDWLVKHSDEPLPGFNISNHQLFFLNFAQVWCGSSRPEAAKNRLKTAVHSPGRFRVIGTLRNSYDFAAAYQCPMGTPMNPVSKCMVW